ncbi:MAG: autotransporter domain-containing protein [Akkermansia sp.]|nr:autotransporter domain-containing protein [Akkermansia sp.]
MKLHLPSRLRAALLSCLSAAVFTLTSGVLLQPAWAASLYFDAASPAASHITWQEGANFAYDQDPTQALFATDDDVVMLKSAELTLGGNVKAGMFNVQNKAEVTLTGDGHRLTAEKVEIGKGSALRLTDDALAAGVKVTGYSDSLLVFDFGGGTASYDAHLSGYKGRVEVHNSTWALTPSNDTAYTRVSLTGDAVLQLGGGSVLKAPVVMLGNNTVEVANGTATMQGEISGSGTLVKTGEGTLNIGPSDEVFRGTLDIQAGTVQWRNDVDNSQVQNVPNSLAFSTIKVGEGATFEDGHIGINLGDVTDLVIQKGTVKAHDMKDPGGALEGLMENRYRSLHVVESATLDADWKVGRNFGLLTAEDDSTLTINNGNDRTYNTFCLIRDFSGTINGEEKNDNQKLIIGAVEQSAGKKLTVELATTATDFAKRGEGELELTQTLTASGTIAAEGGAMKVGGAVTTGKLAVSGEGTTFAAEADVTAASGVSVAAETTVKGALTVGSADSDAVLSVTGGSLTVDGAVNFKGSAEFGPATVMLKNGLTSALVGSRISIAEGADVTVVGSTEATMLGMTGGQLKAAAVHVSDMMLSGGELTSTAEVRVDKALVLNGGNLLMQEGNTGVQAGSLLVANGSTLEAKSLSVKSLTLADGTLTIAEDVTVSKQLTMNYGGTLSIGNTLTLSDGAVLSYDSALEHTVQFGLSDLSAVSRLYVDVTNVTEADLQSGLNTGLAYGLQDKLSIGSLADYTFENREGILYLVANAKTPVFGWDDAWGSLENATAPETMPEVAWTTVAEKVGLYGSPYYDKDNVIAANVTGGTVTGNASRVNQIFGGAYGTQPIDAAGGTIERDIWLNIDGGKFEIVGGGSYSLTSPLGEQSGAAAAWNLKGDTHVQIQSGAAVGSVFGSNVNAVKDPTHEGNSYVSVYSSQVAGSVVGSGFQTKGQVGDTYVYIYAPLSVSDPTKVIDRTITDMSEGMIGNSVAANAVVGGVLAGGNADMQGSTTVTLDFANAGGTMVKTIAAGNMNQGTQAQTGDVTLNLHHIGGASLTGAAVVSGHASGTNQSHTGNARLEILDAAGSSVTGRIVGGHDSTAASAVQNRIGSTEILIAEAAGANLSGNLSVGHYLVGGTSYTQQQEGELTLTVKDSEGISLGVGDGVLTAGHYAVMPNNVLNAATAIQTHTGNNTIVIANSAKATVHSNVVGGHYLDDQRCENGNHSTDTNPVQTQSGAVSISISGVAGGAFGGNIVLGNYATGAQNAITALNVRQTQQGDAVLTIDDSKANFVGEWLVGGHFANIHANSTTTQSHTDGDIRVTIGGGDFRNRVVMGDVHDFTNDWNSTITGGTYLTVTGGNFYERIVGASLNTGGNASTAHVGSVHMDFSNTSLNGSSIERVALVGGYDLNGRGTATVGDISISFNKTKVGAEVYGGTWYKGGTTHAVVQGNISLDLTGGSFAGNIYAAGRTDAAGILTASTTVSIDDTASFSGKLQVSGGYKGQGGSLVTGNKTLSFTSAGSTYGKIANVTFTEFDTVNVAAADTTVTLKQNLQLMSQAVTKTGEGKLKLYKENELDNLSVRGGTLQLAGNSAGKGGTLIEHLLVEGPGTLDISEGNCGINGMLTMADGAGLNVRVNQAAAAITDLNWEGMVTLNVLDATPENMAAGYEIALFSGLSQSHLSGLELDRVSGIDGLAASAEQYIDSVYANDAYIVLRQDGSLVLTTKERQAAYWVDGSGEWSSTEAKWYEEAAPVGTPTGFESDVRTFFVGDGSTADVTITEDVAPYTMVVQNGTFNFAAADEETVTLKSDLVLENATVTMDNEVKFAGARNNISVDENSSLSLNANDEVTVYDVDNAGLLDVGDAAMTVTDALRNSGTIKAGSLELSKGTQQGGTVETGNLVLADNTTFDALTADAVTGNTDHTLSLKGDSTIGSLDGGSVNLVGGTTTLKSDTTLDTLTGSGEMDVEGSLSLQNADAVSTLKVADKLTLQKASAVDTLEAGSIEVNDTLTVNTLLKTDALTLSNAGDLNADAPLVSAASAGTLSAAKMDITVDGNDLQNKGLITGTDYYLFKADYLGCALTVNGAATDQVTDGRYLYTIKSDSHGLKLTSEVQNIDYYTVNAETENGKAGAALLDGLFVQGNTALAQPNSDLAKLVKTLDTLAGSGNKPELDKLTSAVAGASIPGVGMAMGHDVERQLRAIRNRTTTMGVDQSVVNEEMPYFNSWINAEGDYASISGDGTEAGYSMSSFGGTVGMDVDMTPHLTCGLALTAMHGKYSSDDVDNADGQITTEYLSLFARYARHAWTHTFVATGGIMQADIDRDVHHANGSYSTSGSTNGTAFGLMYEVGHVSSLNAEGSLALQPFANVSYVHASLSGYDEEGSDAALKVGDVDYNAVTVGLGARLQGLGGENLYNRSAIYELRALAKLHAGDRSAEAEMQFADGKPATVTSAEVGSVGGEVGAGITIPVGSMNDSVFADVSVEFNSAYVQVNGTIGYRVNF